MDNFFNVEPQNTYPQSINMIELVNCGPLTNKIYRNKFYNLDPNVSYPMDITAVALYLDNENIDIWCNDFFDCRYGITVHPGSIIHSVWLNHTGDRDFVNNEFFGGSDRIKDLDNRTGAPIIYCEDQTLYSNIIKNTTDWPRIGTYHHPELILPVCSDWSCDEWPVGVAKPLPIPWTTGIKTYNLKPFYKIYPNPARVDNFLNVEYYSGFTGMLQIVDIHGSVMRSLAINEEMYEMKMEISSFAPGIYFVNLMENDGKRFSEKFVIID